MRYDAQVYIHRMESPSRRGPPPPSSPPPRNISRSGRVPPPKGAPPGSARRARQAGRGSLTPQALESRARTESTSSVDTQQRNHDRALGRCGHVEQESLSDETGLSAESSRESLEDSVGPEHRPGSRPSPGVPQQRHCPRTSFRNRREESYQDRNRSRAEEKRRGLRSPKQRSGRHKQTLKSETDSSRSSDDGILDDDRADANGGTAGGDGIPREEARRKGRDRNRGWRSQRKESRSNAPLSGGNGQENNVTSHSSSEEDSGKWATIKRERRNQRLQMNNSFSKLPKERSSSQSGASHRTDSFSSDAAAEDAPRSDVLDGGDSQFRTRSSEKSPGSRQSKSEESGQDKRSHLHRRRRAEQDDSEAECYGWSGNRYSWDMSDATSIGSISGQLELSEPTPNGGDEGVKRKSTSPSSDKEEGAAHHTGDDNNSIAESHRSLTTTAHDSGKHLDNSNAFESGQKQPTLPQCEEKTGGSSSTHTPAHSSRAQDVKSSPTPPESRAVIAGKPIRGARWGEAIGVRSRVFDTSTIPTKRVDLKNFVSSPLRSGPGTVLRCYIERDRSGTHKISNVFSMYADLDDGNGRMLLAARKLLASKTAYYIICVRQDDLFRDSGKRGGSSFLAKLRASSVAHTEYALYDRGDNPATAATETGVDRGAEAKPKSTRNPIDLARPKTPRHNENHEQREFRRELGVIHYKFDKKEQRTGKRRMEVAIPQLQEEGDSWEPVSWQPGDTKESMISNFGRIRYQGAQNFLQDDRLLVYHQRESRYDPLSSCLVDYRGRATAPSVKNFQLLKSPPEDNVKRARYFSEGAGKDEHESDDLPRPVYLQMGKVGKDCFNVDLEWPLSILQAFAICLSRFDTQAHF